VVRVVLAAALAAVLCTAARAEPPAALPPVAFQDQDGRVLELASLRGRVVVVVYGDRHGVERHVAWGRKLDADLRARGVYQPSDPPEARAVQILAVAQMGGIPAAFRDVLRAFIRPHVEKGYSLWLDWENVLSAAFGGRAEQSTVLVADRAGRVQTVVSGAPEDQPLDTVRAAIQRLQ
jgi:hypothetical protein